MNLRSPLAGVALVAIATVPATAPAQSAERNIERWAESIAATAERIAAQVERKANLLAARIEREFEQRERREGRRRDRITDDDWQGSDRDLPFQAMRIDTTFAFSASGVVDLSAVYGDIVVTGWERREARVKAYTERGRLEYDFSSSRVTIEHRADRGRGRSDSDMRYEVSVPRGVRVMLRTTSGDIEVRGTGAGVEANTNSGDITIEDVAQRLEVGTISGDVILRKVKGIVEVNSVNGSVDATDVEGDVHLESTSGDLTAIDIRGRDVELSTNSGDVSFAGTIDPTGRYEFHSHSGTLDLSIPAATNARFSVETFSGDIESDFPITLMPGDRMGGRPRRFEFNVGTGGPRIIAESFSGDVEIRKR